MRYKISRAFVASVVLALVALVSAMTWSSSWSVFAWNSSGAPIAVPLGEGDSAFNYDFLEPPSTASSNVDWPVNIIFWYDASKTKVENFFWGSTGEDPTHLKNLKLDDGDGAGPLWNSDLGSKDGVGLLEPDNHFRQYAANGTSMTNSDLGSYTVATSHQDKIISLDPLAFEWYGNSEIAEQNIASQAEDPTTRGFIVERDVISFCNLELENPFRVEIGPPPLFEQHIWYNNGMATKIKIFDYLGVTSLDQEERPADRVIQVPLFVNDLKERLSPYNQVTKSLLTYRARVTYPYDVSDPAHPNGIEMKGVSDGDSPFSGIGADINNQAGRTKFWSTTSNPTSGLPIKVARLTPVIIGSNQEVYILERVFDALYTSDGLSVSQPKVEVKSTYQRGDTDGNGAINITDALFISQYLAQLKTLDSIRALNAASVRHDTPSYPGNRITVQDSMFIAQYLSGLRDAWYNLITSLSMRLSPVPPGKVSVAIPSTKLAQGANTSIPIVVKGIPVGTAGLGAYDLRIEFDPGVVRVQGIVSNDKTFPKPAAVLVDNAKGVIYLNGYTSSLAGITGEVTLGTLQVMAVGKSGDATPIRVTVTTLSDSYGNEIAATTDSGSLTLQSN